MNQPQNYSESCNIQRKPIVHVLENYLSLIRWKEDGATVMDVGCGPGDVTVDTLLPLLPSNYKQLIGSDQSKEMVEYAREKFGKERIDFMVMDIEKGNLPVGLEGKFDHVFSFFCLHWVINQRQAFSNFNYLLKTGGDMLLTFLVDVTHFRAYEVLYQTEKWRRLMKDYEKYVCPYMHVQDPVKDLREILDSAEFNIRVCKLIDGYFYFENRSSMKLALKSVNPFVHYMNENVREDFMEDLTKLELDMSNSKDRNEEIYVPYKLLVVVAEKKRNLQ